MSAGLRSAVVSWLPPWFTHVSFISELKDRDFVTKPKIILNLKIKALKNLLSRQAKVFLVDGCKRGKDSDLDKLDGL